MKLSNRVKCACPLCGFFVSAASFYACFELLRTHAFEMHDIAIDYSHRQEVAPVRSQEDR
jgi:hypothetical protein